MISIHAAAGHRRSFLAGMTLLAVAACFVQPVPLAAGGLFRKKVMREPKIARPAKPKPFQSVFGPKTREPVRAVPVDPPSASLPALYAPSVSGTLSPVPRIRPDLPRVLVLGDSQSLLPFGDTLQKTLVSGGCEVLFHGVKNGTPYFWQGNWPSPVLTRIYEPAASAEACGRSSEVSMIPRSIAEYVAAYDPDVFVFQAGTNFEEDLAGETTAGIVAKIEASLRDASARGAKILWIGPPDARDDVKSPEFQERAVTTLRTALVENLGVQGYDLFLDSRDLCPIPNDHKGDGEHPDNETGSRWGDIAGKWVVDRVQRWRCDGTLRSSPGIAPPPAANPVPDSFTRSLQQASPPARAFEVDLTLEAKSDPGDIATLPYTDAFSVYRYRIARPTEMLPQLLEFGLPVDLSKGAPVVYVLHWTVHNAGQGPLATRVAAREIGGTYRMRLNLLSEHPLGPPLGTMPRFDDFNDFGAPVFVAADLLAERAF